ncbi:MAG: hypothetical protein H6968_11615 [Chromatiaceae bacterium]|nr:hypothetical protein [Chromatiaceae bacterium]
MKKLIQYLGFLLFCSMASTSWATAIFDSSTYFKLTYEGFTTNAGGGGSLDVTVVDLSITPGGGIATNGNATGSFAEAADTNGNGASLNVGEWVELESSVAGQTTNGDVSGASSVGAILEIVNNFAETVTVEFSLMSGYDFFTSADSGDSADAFLEMVLVAYGSIPDDFVVDRILSKLPLPGDANETSNGLATQSLFFDLPAGEFIGIDAFLTAEGSAEASMLTVAEPGLIGLLVLGLSVLGISRKTAH